MIAESAYKSKVMSVMPEESYWPEACVCICTGMGLKARKEGAMSMSEIKQTLRQITGNQMFDWESEVLPTEQREEFWEHVIAFETGTSTTDFERLVKAGVELPAPESMDDAVLSNKLWEVIRNLAQMRVYLSQTDHLTDRELYARLWNQSFREEIPTGLDVQGNWHLDLISSGSDEDIELYLRFYADEQERLDWSKSFPDYVLPEHRDAPYDRDRDLPQASKALKTRT